MKNEEKIIEMLEEVLGKQEEHSKVLEGHGKILEDHSSILENHSKILGDQSRILGNHSEILENHSKTLADHDQKFENQSAQLTEHSQMLKALLSGQEHLKADLDGFKISTGKAFEKLNEEVDTLTINDEILRNDTHTNKVDIQRIKKTMGMA